MKFHDILNEFEIKVNDNHYQDRTVQRFFGQKYFDVATFNKQLRYETQTPKIIGLYKIPQQTIDTVKNILEHLENPYYSADPTTMFIVKLYTFNIDTNDIIFTGNPKQQEINKNLVKDKTNTYWFLQERPMDDNLSTKQNISQGNALVCYVVDNFLRTILLTRSINPDSLIRKAKESHKGKNVVYIDNPFTQLDAYIDVDKLRTDKENYQAPDDDEIIPPPVDEPQLTNKEKRLLDYKERMKKLYKY